MLREISSVFSFLTILPASNSSLENTAKYMYLFPIVGIAIGLLIGSMGFGLSMFLDPLVVGLLVVSALAIVTGIHHTDGLADFADGLMVKGSKEKKIKAMKDLSVGSAGIVSIVLYLMGLIIAISLKSGYELFLVILLGEITAKYSMVLMAAISKSASVGLNSPFLQLMKDKKKLAVSTVIAFLPIVILGGISGVIIFGAAIMFTLFMTGLSTRSFGGITGDVLGATNELTRLVSMLIFVSL